MTPRFLLKQKDIQILVPNHWARPSDEYQYRGESVTSVSQKISKPVFIKPNPASSKASLVYDLINTSKPKFIISDLSGRKLFFSSLNEKENEFTFSTNMIPKGMYIYKVMDGEKLLHKGKFTIQH